jgi:hypothetical protein
VPLPAWKLQLAFGNYPLIVVGLMSDPVCWLSASHLEPTDDPEMVAAIKHGLADLELV